MLPDYTYFRPAVPKEELAAYFAQRLGLVRIETEESFSLRSDQWWMTIVDPDEDWEIEADRLGLSLEQMTTVIFAPERDLGAEESFQANVDLFAAIIDQLNDTPGITGLLQYDDEKVLIERPVGGPTLLDTSLADSEEYNHDNRLALVLSRGVITDLPDLEYPDPASNEEG
ncbi:hypothetical protein [Glycomyces sp. NRRL B-16210]|uniref:hypothetical protein n=1 Tax=Glycomyces sp. NRRL B-16210 TaxID=1463821 RepID=UPI0004BFAE1B|nr:hypothetical protein [Glycomyces sp. NRRL B-16210]